jgi:hypothetical protein
LNSALVREEKRMLRSTCPVSWRRKKMNNSHVRAVEMTDMK